MEDRRDSDCFGDLPVLEMHMRYQLVVDSRFLGRSLLFAL
jgi:hypothetical protein